MRRTNGKIRMYKNAASFVSNNKRVSVAKSSKLEDSVIIEHTALRDKEWVEKNKDQTSSVAHSFHRNCVTVNTVAFSKESARQLMQALIVYFNEIENDDPFSQIKIIK